MCLPAKSKTCSTSHKVISTQAWRNKNAPKQLLLSTLAPYQEVKKSTVAGWVKASLGSAGIDKLIYCKFN